jgi:cysteine-rich repeat protein
MSTLRLCGRAVALALLAACPPADENDDTASGPGSTAAATAATESTAEPTTGESTTEANAGSTTAPGVCGDAKVDPGEACDDGNADDRDGCTPTCERAPAIVWCRDFASDNLADLAIGPGGEIVLVGAGEGFLDAAGSIRVWDAAGTLQRESEYTGIVDALAFRDESSFAVLGTTTINDFDQSSITLFSLAGEKLAQWDGPFRFGYSAALARHPDGGFVAADLSDLLWVGRFDDSLHELWRHSVGQPGAVVALAVDPAGTHVLGATAYVEDHYAATLLARASDGTPLWDDVHDPLSLIDIAPGPAGSMFVFGDASDGFQKGALDPATGAWLEVATWPKIHQRINLAQPLADPTGGLVLGGWIPVGPKQDVSYLALVADSGQPIWDVRMPAADSFRSDVQVSALSPSDGTLVFAGQNQPDAASPLGGWICKLGV